MAISEPPNPLRGISHDSADINNFLDQIPGPVVAVGHSYGGAVIANAASGADNVVGLVYVVAFAPDNGETLACVGRWASPEDEKVGGLTLRLPGSGRRSQDALVGVRKTCHALEGKSRHVWGLRACPCRDGRGEHRRRSPR